MPILHIRIKKRVKEVKTRLQSAYKETTKTEAMYSESEGFVGFGDK